MDYEIIQSKDNSGEYIVEAIDFESDGEIYVTIFSGPDAKQRAEEYCAFKNK